MSIDDEKSGREGVTCKSNLAYEFMSKISKQTSTQYHVA
jgi:hypothetical protein